jgi:homoserine kinase type II
VLGAAAYRSHELIDAGTVNSNYRVETAGGPCFLRVNEDKTTSQVEKEAELLRHLSARGVPTPVPFGRVASVRDKPCSLFPWVAGQHLARSELTPQAAHEVGAALSHLHGAGQGFSGLGAGLYTTAHLHGRFERALAGSAHRPVLQGAVSALRVRFSSWRRSPGLPVGVIHQDLFMDNVLFEGGKVVALLDFEQACDGVLVYDLAVTLLAWCYGQDDFVDHHLAALCRGYLTYRTLEPTEREALFDECRLAAMRFAITRITDVELRASAPAGKDYRRYLARLERLEDRGPSAFRAACGL